MDWNELEPHIDTVSRALDAIVKEIGKDFLQAGFDDNAVIRLLTVAVIRYSTATIGATILLSDPGRREEQRERFVTVFSESLRTCLDGQKKGMH